jgi:hypothetical protein
VSQGRSWDVSPLGGDRPTLSEMQGALIACRAQAQSLFTTLTPAFAQPPIAIPYTCETAPIIIMNAPALHLSLTSGTRTSHVGIRCTLLSCGG